MRTCKEKRKFGSAYAGENRRVKTEKSGGKKEIEKNSKKVKKGVDRRLMTWYYMQVAASKTHTKSLERSDVILENDTESRRTR